jgi:SAM-dependent methyltransferase
MDNKNIYELHDWHILNEQTLRLKIDKILSIIPESVETIVDIGCGNGVITNQLSQKYSVVGVDRSRAALEYVRCDYVQSSSESIPLPDYSFDMSFTSELLEHLEDDTYKKTIAEIKRLSKKYILVTVPNGENPDKLSIQCPSCLYRYNRPNHLRSLNIQDFKQNYQEYDILQHFVFGRKVRYYNPAILNLKLKFSPPASWIPYYWIEKNVRNTICPSCEHKFYYPFKFNLISFFCDVLNAIVSPKKPYWLFVLMKKKD